MVGLAGDQTCKTCTEHAVAEQAAKAEADRVAAEQEMMERLAAEQAAHAEAERVAAEQAAQAERLAADEADQAAKVEAEHMAAAAAAERVRKEAEDRAEAEERARKLRDETLWKAREAERIAALKAQTQSLNPIDVKPVEVGKPATSEGPVVVVNLPNVWNLPKSVPIGAGMPRIVPMEPSATIPTFKVDHTTRPGHDGQILIWNATPDYPFDPNSYGLFTIDFDPDGTDAINREQGDAGNRKAGLGADSTIDPTGTGNQFQMQIEPDKSIMVPASGYQFFDATSNSPISNSSIVLQALGPGCPSSIEPNSVQEQLPDGNFKLTASAQGYDSNSWDVFRLSSITNSQRIVKKFLNPNDKSKLLSKKKCRAVLSWSEHPADLDFHVTSSSGLHVFYGSQGDSSHVQLDVDVQNGKGPETITADMQDGVSYYFYVQHYSGSSTLAKSNARIDLLGMGLEHPLEMAVATTEVSYSPCGNGHWLAFMITGDKEVKQINRIVNCSSDAGLIRQKFHAELAEIERILG